MKEFKFYSSGGVGDALIISLKIRKTKQEYGVDSLYYWTHVEKHACHKWPINEIMKTTIQSGFYSCYIRDDAEKFAMEQCKNADGIYLDTKISDLKNPYMAGYIGERCVFYGLGSEYNKKHIIVQVCAGRMYDNTKRTIGINVINSIAKRFPQRNVVLIGPEQIEYKEKLLSNIQNMTGKTETIIDALSYINMCSLFIGQDGVCAYYAMMKRKPTIVNFHIDSLINHYFNKEWAMHSISLIGGGNNLEYLNLNNPETQALFDMVNTMDNL